MARFVFKTNTFLHRQHHHHHPFFKPVTLSLRHRSSQPTNNNPTLIELDLASSSSSSSSESGEYEVTMKLFNDLIHRILVKKATPDWLPFVPGSSFWVPPRPTPSNVVDLVHKLTTNDLSPEESLSLASLQGWPSSNFFLKGVTPFLYFIGVHLFLFFFQITFDFSPCPFLNFRFFKLLFH